MPKREDLYPEAEYVEPEQQLHRHVLYHTQPGDLVVVDARADMSSGVFGEMMMTYFRGRGGLGVVIDGCIRDSAEIKRLGLGLWLRGVTPNFHTQTNIFPFAVNVPIACGGVTVLPVDLIVADDDGAVVVPVALAPELARKASEHVEWEEFSRLRLSEGGDLRKYYPFTDLNDQAFLNWDFGHIDPTGAQWGKDANGNIVLYTAGDLAAVMALNVDLKVLSANGYFDSVMPFSQTTTDLQNMPLQDPTVRNNLTMKYYPSGHMVYLDGDSRTKLKADLAALYTTTTSNTAAVARVRALQAKKRGAQTPKR